MYRVRIEVRILDLTLSSRFSSADFFNVMFCRSTHHAQFEGYPHMTTDDIIETSFSPKVDSHLAQGFVFKFAFMSSK